jgi:hypothetical protein
MFGAPGETPETISETLGVIDNFQVPHGVWVTIGICLWTDHQRVLEDARADGQPDDNRALFNGADYVSPQLPKDYVTELLEPLRMKENYTVQVNKLYADYYNDNLGWNHESYRVDRIRASGGSSAERGRKTFSQGQ